MPTPSRSREEVLGILLETFRRDGYDGASLTSLSEATGLGRSSLYHHFPGGKEDMVAQVLELVGAWLQREVIGPLGARAEPPAARLERMFETLRAFYADGQKACIIGRLCASVDRAHFQAPLRQVLLSWIGALAETLMEAGLQEDLARERAEDTLSRLQGSLVLAEGLADPGPFQRTLQRLRRDLLTPGAAG
jgi:TetR/AcrR family transcriptional repressor of lmrAB and yxaGH operons